MAYRAQADPSGRATCIKCRGKIPKGALRFGVEQTLEDHVLVRWSHAQCFRFPKTILAVEDMVGFDDLSPELQEEARECFSAVRGGGGGGARGGGGGGGAAAAARKGGGTEGGDAGGGGRVKFVQGDAVEGANAARRAGGKHILVHYLTASGRWIDRGLMRAIGKISDRPKESYEETCPPVGDAQFVSLPGDLIVCNAVVLENPGGGKPRFDEEALGKVLHRASLYAAAAGASLHIPRPSERHFSGFNWAHMDGLIRTRMKGRTVTVYCASKADMPPAEGHPEPMEIDPPAPAPAPAPTRARAATAASVVHDLSDGSTEELEEEPQPRKTFAKTSAPAPPAPAITIDDDDSGTEPMEEEDDDDDDDGDGDGGGGGGGPAPPLKGVGLVLLKISDKSIAQLVPLVEALGGTVGDSWVRIGARRSTHLVVPDSGPSLNAAMASPLFKESKAINARIVKAAWLVQCIKQKRRLPEANYLVGKPTSPATAPRATTTTTTTTTTTRAPAAAPAPTATAPASAKLFAGVSAATACLAAADQPLVDAFRAAGGTVSPSWVAFGANKTTHLIVNRELLDPDDKVVQHARKLGAPVVDRSWIAESRKNGKRARHESFLVAGADGIGDKRQKAAGPLVLPDVFSGMSIALVGIPDQIRPVLERYLVAYDSDVVDAPAAATHVVCGDTATPPAGLPAATAAVGVAWAWESIKAQRALDEAPYRL